MCTHKRTRERMHIPKHTHKLKRAHALERMRMRACTHAWPASTYTPKLDLVQIAEEHRWQMRLLYYRAIQHMRLHFSRYRAQHAEPNTSAISELWRGEEFS